jgi:hypothetical protein
MPWAVVTSGHYIFCVKNLRRRVKRTGEEKRTYKKYCLGLIEGSGKPG